jgi:NAD(P)-dependent dehydrogenase (short-subunit alcohol dehydrogenase family)
MSQALSSQIAIVTGGSSGIGKALAAALAQSGCRVVIAGRDPAKTEAASREIPRSQFFAPCDVGQAADVDQLFEFTQRELGPPTLVVNCAGISRSPRLERHVPVAISATEEPWWDDVLRTNLKGAFLVARAAMRCMLPLPPAAEGGLRGQILNISSARAARRGLPFGASYCASKRAALLLFDALAEEAAPLGIRVMSLLPDVVSTPMIAGTDLARRGALSPENVAQFSLEMLQRPAATATDSPALIAATVPLSERPIYIR